MLSDEEKKAVNQLKADTSFYELFKIEVYKKDVDVILNLIEKQSKEIEELKQFKKQVEEIESTNFIKYKNYISKDKIKAKIEELEIEQESNREDLKIAIDNLLFKNIDKIGNKISINMSVRGILQSLLEKE